MARIVLGGLTTLNLATHLDPMFAEIYTFTFSGGFVGLGRTPVGEIFESSRAISVHGTLMSATGPKMALDHNAATGLSRVMTFGATTGAAGTFEVYQASSNNSVTRTALSIQAAGHVQPGTDNTQTLGASGNRWSVVYAGTGTINTSDAREKTDVRPFSKNEIAAAKALCSEIGVFRFLSSVAEKTDDARDHIGLTVQRAIEIMSAHGLSPFRYAFICHDKWPPKLEPAQFNSRDTGFKDSSGKPIYEEVETIPERNIPGGDRYGFRYDQLALFIMRGLEARIAALEE